MKSMEIEMKEIKPPIKKYLGRWVNPYNGSRAIGEFMFFVKNGELFMTSTGADSGHCPGEWKAAPVYYHSYAPDTTDAVAFRSQLELEDMHVLLAINENKGLLVIAAYFTYKNKEGRSDFFVREFFSKHDYETAATKDK
jgi:hypothetical protein